MTWDGAGVRWDGASYSSIACAEFGNVPRLAVAREARYAGVHPAENRRIPIRVDPTGISILNAGLRCRRHWCGSQRLDVRRLPWNGGPQSQGPPKTADGRRGGGPHKVP